MTDYDSITFHTAACDDHFDRLLNVHGPEGLDDVCPLCEIERLTAELELKRGVIDDLAEEHSALKMHYSKLQAELKQANAVVERLEAAAKKAVRCITAWTSNCDYRAEPDLQLAVRLLREALSPTQEVDDEH